MDSLLGCLPTRGGSRPARASPQAPKRQPPVSNRSCPLSMALSTTFENRWTPCPHSQLERRRISCCRLASVSSDTWRSESARRRHRPRNVRGGVRDRMPERKHPVFTRIQRMRRRRNDFSLGSAPAGASCVGATTSASISAFSRACSTIRPQAIGVQPFGSDSVWRRRVRLPPGQAAFRSRNAAIAVSGSTLVAAGQPAPNGSFGSNATRSVCPLRPVHINRRAVIGRLWRSAQTAVPGHCTVGSGCFPEPESAERPRRRPAK